ncbi:MAG TPA: hypothetical protein VFE51_20790 [Verrucomicrobiae bacterium]|nr:hypothetical protein [Verrucomicrobiae bacterium]
MNPRVFGVGLCIALLPVIAIGEDDRPILKESPAKLVAAIEALAKENVAVARVNVAHDVAHKQLRIFTIVPSHETKSFKESGFEVEIIYNYELACAQNGVASCSFQNNNQVLSFAASQFTSGDKAFAKRLVRVLAEAEPSLFWSSPSDPVITITQIVVGLEKDDETVKRFLADETQTWKETVKKYGP